MKQSIRGRLLASSTICGASLAVAMALAPAQAAAQDAAQNAAQGGAVTSTTGAESTSGTVKEVVVTGSLLSRKNYTSDAPLSIITSNDLSNRGITTVQGAIQTLSANGAGNLPNSFSANGAFAAGASAVSLRGLTTNSTLVLIDGLREAYYPLADDGTRNFVDLNTIPDIIVDRVETLKDGASSTYGADAIAGVVNIITKKTFEGVEARAEGGTSQQGGGAEYTFQGIVGKGNLADDGYNFYVAGEYQHDDALYNRDRGFPYNTADLSSLCGTSVVDGSKTCRVNGVTNGLQADGTYLSTVPGANTVAAVRAYTAAGTPVGTWQLLNPAAGCGALPSITFTQAMLPSAAQQASLLGSTLCQQDLTHDYRQIAPEDTRYNLDFKLTKSIGNDSEFYLQGVYYRNEVTAQSYVGPPRIRNTATPAPDGLTNYSTATNNISLPVYVCPTGVGCNAANGTLDPYNPFAAQGNVARIYYRFGDINEYNQYTSQVYRLATGIHGTVGDGWHYSADMTYSQNDLENKQYGNIYIANLLTAINEGLYNFANPSQNTAAVRNFIAPVNTQDSISKLFQVTGTVSKALFDLPGGPLQLAIGGDFRYESIYDPSANPDPLGGDPTQRYFDINPFFTIGSRHEEAGFFEIDAPIIKAIDIDIGGRYDNYSTGQSHFSPKVGVKYKITDWLTFRGTWAQGFRIPSFAETNSAATGYITVNAPASFLAAHGNNGYGQGYSLGLVTVGTSDLKPETSTNASVGFVFQPVSNWSFSLDYYRIEKDNVIAAADPTPAINAYYAGTAIPAGFKVIPGTPDPDHPNAQPELGFVEYGFANQNSMFTDGFDFAATGRMHLGPVAWTSLLDGTYVARLNETLSDGSVQHFAGTIGPYNITSASGTPRWKITWSNTFSWEKLSTTLTMYYTSGYDEEGEDVGGVRGDCLGSAANTGVPTTYLDGVTPASCSVRGFMDWDAHVQYQLNPKVQVYTDIINLFNSAAPYDPTTYGGYQYNPAWGNAGIYGRFFKVGVKATF